MLGFPLGILSAAGAGGVEATYELIETSILGSGQAEVVFSSLATYASTYKHLQLRASVTSTRSANDDNFRVHFNSDTSSSYRSHRLIGTGSSVISSTLGITDRMFAGAINAATGTADSYSGLVIDILDFASTTKNTTIRSFGGQTNTSFVYLYSGGYFKTDAITSITLSAESGNLSTKSRLSLYGIRG
jgi:hypothetical protein